MTLPIQAGDEVMYFRGDNTRDPVWCDVQAVYKDGSVYVVLPSYDACVLEAGKIAGWVRSTTNHRNKVRQLSTPPATEAQQADLVGDPPWLLTGFAANRIANTHRVSAAAVQDIAKAVHAALAAAKPEPQQPAQGVATRQVVPLSREQMQNIYAENHPAGTFFNSAVRSYRAIEHACAEAWGVKLAGGGEGV